MTKRLRDLETSDSRIVISSASEKSLSFAVRRTMFGKFKTGNLLSRDLRASLLFILHGTSHRLSLKAGIKISGQGLVARD